MFLIDGVKKKIHKGFVCIYSQKKNNNNMLNHNGLKCNDVCSTFYNFGNPNQKVCKLTNWQTSPNVASYYRDNMVRYPRCFTPAQNYAQYTKSIALNKVRRFNSVALKRAKSQRCFGVVLM